MSVLYGSFAPTHGQTLGQVVISGYAFPMEILQLNWTGIKRDAIEVTNMNVQPTTSVGQWGNKMYLPSAYVDPGELDLKVLHNPTVAIPIADWSKQGPTTITITLGPSTSQQETFTCLGFLTSYDLDGPLDGTALTASVKIKLTDSVSNSYSSTGGVSYTSAS